MFPPLPGRFGVTGGPFADPGFDGAGTDLGRPLRLPSPGPGRTHRNRSSLLAGPDGNGTVAATVNPYRMPSVLTATSPGGNYAPTFTGNGNLGVRVPPAGQGYAGGSVPAESTLAGFYAQAPGQVQQRANLPTWSTLTFSDGGQDFSLGAGQVTGWQQQLDLHTGVISTTATWTAPDGHVTDLRYEVFTDRARPDAAVVRLQLIPRWSGTATVTDLIDGAPATLTAGIARGFDAAAHRDWETIRTLGTGIIAGLASTVNLSANAGAVTDTQVTGSDSQTVGQQLSFGVSAGATYTVSKYVGVRTGPSAASAAAAAQRQSAAAAAAGLDGTLSENAAAWQALWNGRIDVLGDPGLATDVNMGRAHSALVIDENGSAQGWCQYGSPAELPAIKLRQAVSEAGAARQPFLPSGQQHVQAGDAAFEFLELADVHHDRGEAQVVQELSGAGADAAISTRSPPSGTTWQPPSSATGRTAGNSPAGTSCGRSRNVPSGSAVTADFRCSTFSSGTAITVRPSGASSARSWRMPAPLVRPPRPTYTVWPACSTSPPSRVPGSWIRAVRRPSDRSKPGDAGHLGPAGRRARAGQHRQVLAGHHRIFDEHRVRAVLRDRRRCDHPATGRQRIGVLRVLGPGQGHIHRGPADVGDDALGQPAAGRADQNRAVHRSLPCLIRRRAHGNQPRGIRRSRRVSSCHPASWLPSPRVTGHRAGERSRRSCGPGRGSWLRR